jgi:hypothetical protein
MTWKPFRFAVVAEFEWTARNFERKAWHHALLFERP